MSVSRETFLRSAHRSSVERANRQVLEIVAPPLLRMKGIKENVRSFRAQSLDFPVFSRLRNYEGLCVGRMLLHSLSPFGAHTLSFHSKVLLTRFIKSSLSYCNHLSRIEMEHLCVYPEQTVFLFTPSCIRSYDLPCLLGLFTSTNSAKISTGTF